MRLDKQLPVFRFAAEGERIERGEGGKNFYGTLRKNFSGRNGKYGRKFQHRVCPGEYGMLCPRVFIEQGNFAPLGKIAAHNAYD